MSPNVITREAISSNKVDYSKGTYKRIYEINGIIYYFCVHPEFYYDEDGLDFTGEMLIVLLSPNGLVHFTVGFNQEKKAWEPADQMTYSLVDEMILQMISDDIIESKNQA